jgi:hypothetical protein
MTIYIDSTSQKRGFYVIVLWVISRKKCDNSQAIHTWQTQWNGSPMGRFAHKIHPKVNRVSWFKNFNLNRNQIVLLNRLMSNHSRDRAHLYRNNIVVDQACPCGHATKNINHQLFDCPLNIKIRPRLINKLNAENIPQDIKKIWCASRVREYFPHIVNYT